MSRQPERHFDTVWRISMLNVALLTLMTVMGVPHSIVSDYALLALGWFGGAEIAAGGVREGRSGTKTAWLFWYVRNDAVRVLIGVWMAVLMFFVFPAHWFWFVVAIVFLLWLPKHYTKPGAIGPVDIAARRLGSIARWLGRITGLDKII